jgi:hypothetical protein
MDGVPIPAVVTPLSRDNHISQSIHITKVLLTLQQDPISRIKDAFADFDDQSKRFEF